MNDVKQPQRNIWRELQSDLTPAVVISLGVLAVFVFIVIFAPFIAPYKESEILTDESFSLSSEAMLLGSDFLGRDILSRLIYGLRVTLSVALAISLLSFVIGGLLGFMAAVLRGKADMVLSRIMDALISFPSLIIALIVVSSLGSSFTVLIITMALIDSTRVFRVARAVAMDVVVQDYIEAAKVRGEGLWWIVWGEMLPNTLGPLMAEFGIRFTYAILFISTLSFLGLGVQPPYSDLGLMVKENIQGLLYGSYAPLYSAACIAIVTISVNTCVDWFLKSTSASLPEEL
jgi:peptide/nickel transport system permease protein